MRIYNTLQNFIRQEYHKRGFQEVGTPNMYNSDLWQKSGHWENYKDDMFVLKVDDKDFGLKPMNCPGHCLMFKSTSRTYREFPIRYADFGVLHRNEASGALTGLTRVRRFQQDDAHIFCRADQIKDGIMASFGFLSHVYETNISSATTLPQQSVRQIQRPQTEEQAPYPAALVLRWKWWVSIWAKRPLASALDERIGPGNWALNPEDGAFYGPKVCTSWKIVDRRSTLPFPMR